MNLPDLRCSVCAKIFPVGELAWRCSCGGVLDVAPFVRQLPGRDTLAKREPTLWRYREAMPVPADSAVSMGEGMTPLLPVADLPGVWIKLDFLMPTLSFKDRGATILATLAAIIQPERMIVDSSGNAGSAVAAYAARIGLPCDAFVPAHTSPIKLAQIKAHGATVHLIDGTREDTAAAAAEAAGKPGVLYASHVYHPYFLHGTKTYAYELWERLGEAPETLVLPVRNGTLLLGAYLGFRELVFQGLARAIPRIVGVQAAGYAPLAEGVAAATPARGAQILAAVRATGGTIVTVTDAETMAARADLASRGLLVEPTSALCWAALSRAREENAPPDRATTALRGDSVVVPLGGAGLKTALPG